MKYLRISIFVLFQLTLSGCNIQSYINDNSDLPPAPFNKITSLENVSGSSNYASTAASGYRVKQSAGMLVNKQFTSTQNGYQVFLHVNGKITSGELNQ